MNLDLWNSLPSDIQKVFDEVSEEYITIAGGVWDEASDEGLQYAKDEGLEIITLPPEELARWHECYKPLQEKYIADMEAKGLPGKEFLDEIFQLMEKYK
jgi:TRAP-type C4-dicarboxylate transport system substrate-binding protein